MSLALLFFFFCQRECDVLFFIFSMGASLSLSFCMHLSEFVSYDCKNESSSHQLKYFIFTDLTVLWLSLRIICDVSHSVCSYITPLTFFFLKGNYIQGTKIEKTSTYTFFFLTTCVGALPSRLLLMHSQRPICNRRTFLPLRLH